MICSGYVEITSLEGRSWIKDLQVGDLVLDEEGKYKKITKIIQEDISNNQMKVYDIYYKVDDQTEKGLHRISGDVFIVTKKGKRTIKSTSVKSLKIGNDIWTKDGPRKIVSIIEIPIFSNVGYSIQGDKLRYYYLDDVLVCDTV